MPRGRCSRRRAIAEIVPGLVSTIIPVKNRADMLRRAVDSVLAQTWRAIEIIISDDGSDDDTRELGPALVAAHPGVVHYIWNPNRGAGVAREAGRQLARGEFIQYLDSDDTLWSRKFEVQIAALRAQPECGVAYGWIRLCRTDSPPAETAHKWSGREMRSLFPALLVDRWWNTDAPLWRRSVCDAIGPWSDLRYSQDWDYDARAGALGIRLAYCPQFVTDQWHHAQARQTGHGRWLSPPDRVRFFTNLHRCALAAGVTTDAPEMRHFARWVFSHVRECGRLGDDQAADALCRLVMQAQGKDSIELKLYRRAAAILGWSRVARWSERARSLLGKSVGDDTQKQSWMT